MGSIRDLMLARMFPEPGERTVRRGDLEELRVRADPADHGVECLAGMRPHVCLVCRIIAAQPYCDHRIHLASGGSVSAWHEIKVWYDDAGQPFWAKVECHRCEAQRTEDRSYEPEPDAWLE